MKTKMRKVLTPQKEKDITNAIFKLREKVPEATASLATSTMIEDAKRKKEDIYKLQIPIKLKGEIPRFIFL